MVNRDRPGFDSRPGRNQFSLAQFIGNCLQLIVSKGMDCGYQISAGKGSNSDIFMKLRNKFALETNRTFGHSNGLNF